MSSTDSLSYSASPDPKRHEGINDSGLNVLTTRPVGGLGLSLAKLETFGRQQIESIQGMAAQFVEDRSEQEDDAALAYGDLYTRMDQPVSRAQMIDIFRQLQDKVDEQLAQLEQLKKHVAQIAETPSRQSVDAGQQSKEHLEHLMETLEQSLSTRIIASLFESTETVLQKMVEISAAASDSRSTLHTAIQDLGEEVLEVQQLLQRQSISQVPQTLQRDVADLRGMTTRQQSSIEIIQPLLTKILQKLDSLPDRQLTENLQRQGAEIKTSITNLASRNATSFSLLTRQVVNVGKKVDEQETRHEQGMQDMEQRMIQRLDQSSNPQLEHRLIRIEDNQDMQLERLLRQARAMIYNKVTEAAENLAQGAWFIVGVLMLIPILALSLVAVPIFLLFGL